jgi:hypothetical protein
MNIRCRAVAAASAIAITAALSLAVAGAALPAGSLTSAARTSVQVPAGSARSARITLDVSDRYAVCDEAGEGCWTNEGDGANLKLSGETFYALYNPATVTVNGHSETAWEYESPDGDCVTAQSGFDTKEYPCDAGDIYQEFWYTNSQALYAVGVSISEGHDWCELDTDNHVQNSPCTSAATQPYDMTFPDLP